MKKILLSGFLTALVFSMFAQTQVGRTTYDLQTNGSVGRRVAINAAGEIVVSYTRSNSPTTAFADRGTGYNYSSDEGTTWSETSFPTNVTTYNGPDTSRTGWPDIVYTDNREVLISHFAGGSAPNPTDGIQVQYRDLGSTGPWTTRALLTTNATNTANANFVNNAAWARAASHGDSIFVIFGLFMADYPGMTGGLLMYRSTDAGDTWDGPDEIPLVNSSNFLANGGDNYALDISDNGKIAIVMGTYQVEALTSTDWGATFTKQTVVPVVDLDGNPLPLFNSESGQTMDTVETTDRSYSVVVDDNDLVHVWFGRNTSFKDEASTTTTSYLPLSVSLMYWNETMPQAKILHKTRMSAQQIEQNQPLFSNQLISNSGFGEQLNLYRNALVSQPSGGFDTNGNIYVAYSSIVPITLDDPNDITSNINNLDENGFHYNDIFMIRSSNNGETWEGPMNVSNQPTRECVYPGVPRKIYGTDVPVIWQEDTLGGVQLIAATPPHPVVNNRIMFNKVSLSSIVTPTDITAPTITFFDDMNTNINSAVGCDIDFNTIMENDDVPSGPDSLDFQIVDATALNTAGTHTIDVYVVDEAGNSSDTVQVQVTLDPGPGASLIGPDTLNVLLNGTYTDPGLDYLSTACIPEIAPTITNNVDEMNAGFYTYEYSYTDYLGNAITLTRHVEVIPADNTAPQITLEGNVIETIEACGTFAEPGYTAFDNIDFDLTGSVVITGANPDVNTLGDKIITYSATDAAGNTGSVTRTIRVEDTQAPNIGGVSNGSTIITTLGEPFDPPVATAIDGCDPNPTITNDAATVVDINVEGSYLVTYTATDWANNSSTKNITVIVSDNVGIVDFENLKASVSIFPNPSNGQITIQIDEKDINNVEIKVHDLIGNLITSKTTTNKTTTFDLGSDAAGIYIVTIATDKAKLSKRIIVK